MEKKRSIGVTIFGWVFIISGILGLLTIKNPAFHIKIFGIGTFIFSVAISVADLFCGIFILKLNTHARKAAIFLCLIGIAVTPFYINPVFKTAHSFGQTNIRYEKQKQVILKQYKLEYQQKALEQLEEKENVLKRIFPIFLALIVAIVSLPFVLLDLATIYFFTRPKVKEQFR